MYRILALDGGGIRGLLTAVWLSRLEDVLAKPLWESFDLIAGTSRRYLEAADGDDSDLGPRIPGRACCAVPRFPRLLRRPSIIRSPVGSVLGPWAFLGGVADKWEVREQDSTRGWMLLWRPLTGR
ncbi:MAG: hypothetical protein ABIP48_17670 [Planctomycetota bacterium]